MQPKRLISQSNNYITNKEWNEFKQKWNWTAKKSAFITYPLLVLQSCFLGLKYWRIKKFKLSLIGAFPTSLKIWILGNHAMFLTLFIILFWINVLLYIGAQLTIYGLALFGIYLMDLKYRPVSLTPNMSQPSSTRFVCWAFVIRRHFRTISIMYMVQPIQVYCINWI